MAIKANPNPSHPGEILAGIYLAERGINQTDLAKTEVTGRGQESHCSRVGNGTQRSAASFFTRRS